MGKKGILTGLGAGLVIVSSLTECATPRQPLPTRIAILKTADVPQGIYEEVLRALVGPDARLLVIEDVTQICYDFEHRHAPFNDYWLSANEVIREAHRDCNRKGAVDTRIEVETLNFELPIERHSAIEGFVPTYERPLVTLSRPGFSSDSSVVAVNASYACGPMLCWHSSAFVLIHEESRWRLLHEVGLLIS